MTDHGALLKTAELAYRLAHAVRVYCSLNSSKAESGEPHFDYPQAYSYGKHTVSYEEFALTGPQEDFASAALLHSAIYTMAIQMDTALQECVPDRFNHPDADLQSAAWIARLIRNAFAHDPFSPIWLTYPECDNRVFEVKGVIRLCTNGLNGKQVAREDYGGPLALLRLSEFVRSRILSE
jgi:hypothetical protein